MAAIAGIQDFRQDGVPADIGTFQMQCSILVFQFTFSGTTNIAAVRAGPRGWVLVAYGVDAHTVIQAAINALPDSGGKIFFKNYLYELNDTIILPSNKYGIFLEGETMWRGTSASTDPQAVGFRLANNVNKDMFQVDSKKSRISNVYLDGNKDGQTAGNGITLASNTALDFHLDHVYIMYTKGYGVNWKGGAGYATAVYIEYTEQHAFQIEGARNFFVGCGAWEILSPRAGFNVIGLNNKLIGCHTTGGDYGFIIRGQRGVLDGCTVISSKVNGIWLYGGRYNAIVGCNLYGVGEAADNTYDAIYLNSYTGTHSTGNSISSNIIFSLAVNKFRYGISEADINQNNNIMLGNIIVGYGTAGINKQGPNTILRSNIGFVTENNVLSPAFAIDAVAVVTVTIAHGLAVTPALEDCQLTIVEDSDVDDWACGYVKVESVGAANVVAKVNVTTASATGGATAKLALHVVASG